ncbi:MAG TPA: hypothetical protein VGZ02_17385 [Candidatus Baltobacteraceae bacterium]|jgi:uncharacterized membrane protein YphA (DoxX/SURF4 family)|nr:hypothetical protein [Candidatus Baltobacteraceae bacterium]
MSVNTGFIQATRRSNGERLQSAGLASVRIVLGLVFLMAGVSGFVFLFVTAPPAQPGLAGQFQDVFFRSHWVQFVDGVELLSGLLLLSNRFVTLALTMLGAVIANILAFHISMQPQTIAVPLVVLTLWTVLAYHHRTTLAPLFTK